MLQRIETCVRHAMNLSQIFETQKHTRSMSHTAGPSSLAFVSWRSLLDVKASAIAIIRPSARSRMRHYDTGGDCGAESERCALISDTSLQNEEFSVSLGRRR